MSKSDEFITVSAHLTLGWMPSFAHTLIPEKRRERRSNYYLSLLCLESDWMWLQRTLKIIPRLNDSNPISRSAEGSQMAGREWNIMKKTAEMFRSSKGWAARQCLLFWLMRHYILLFCKAIHHMMRIIKPSILAVVHHPDIFWCWGLAQAIMIAARQHMQMLTGRSHRSNGVFVGLWGWDGMGWFPDDAGLRWTLRAVDSLQMATNWKGSHWSVVKFLGWWSNLNEHVLSPGWEYMWA